MAIPEYKSKIDSALWNNSCSSMNLLILLLCKFSTATLVRFSLCSVLSSTSSMATRSRFKAVLVPGGGQTVISGKCTCQQ